MHTPRIYYPHPLTAHQAIMLDVKASHHLLNVLRLKINEPIILFNGEGGEYKSVLIKIEKKHAVVQLEEYLSVERESPLFLHLAQGVCLGDKMDFVIQKAVELGVNKITPLLTDYSQLKLNTERWSKKITHWRSIIIRACEQCGRNKIPEISEPVTFINWIATGTENIKFIFSPEANQNLSDFKKITPAEICFLVGPEGGWSEKEIVLAEQYHFISLKLGPRILRTETAGLAAICVLQKTWGDF